MSRGPWKITGLVDPCENRPYIKYNTIRFSMSCHHELTTVGVTYPINKPNYNINRPSVLVNVNGNVCVYCVCFVKKFVFDID